jgi:integrase
VLELLGRMRERHHKKLKAGEEVGDWIFPGQKHGEHIKQLRSCWSDFVRGRATVLLWASSQDQTVAGVVSRLRKSLKREPSVRECESAARAAKMKLPRGVAKDRIYDLRHSFASFGAAGGLSLQIIGKLLGHTQARTTQRYSHLADDVLRAAAEKISGTISNAGRGGQDRVSVVGSR